MKRIPSKLTSALVATLLCAAAVTTASSQCSHWDMSGEWTFVQTNGTSPQFTFRQTETGLQGSAVYYYEYNDSGYYFPVRGSVDGTLKGDSFEVTAYWDNGTTGVYTGKIGPQGRIEGTAYDKLHPQTRADWYSDHTARCASKDTCSQWDMSGSWTFVQTNDSSPTFSLQQTRTGLQGTANHSYTHKSECLAPLFNCGDDVYHHSATVNGTVSGNSVEITAYWSNNTTGVYTGWIGPQGRVEGTAYDKQHPETKARWYSDRTAKCLVGTAATGDRIGTTTSALSTVPPPQFIGTFAKTPPNYQPIWVYAIKNDGDMLWYRKDTGESSWQGPKKVGNGWNFKDVIPAGGNSFYALTNEGKLIWYRHDGFNDGSSRNWPAPKEVGHGWNFAKIFSGGDGIIYAIKEDGDLLWYKHGGFADGGGPETWVGPKSLGTEWNKFKDVFCNGGGDIYAVTRGGELVFYHQPGYAVGERRFLRAKTLATGWQNFRQIIPAGGGVILAIKEDGKLLWYRHYFKATGTVRLSRVKEYWEGPVEIGSGWLGFKKVLALLPTAAPVPVVR